MKLSLILIFLICLSSCALVSTSHRYQDDLSVKNTSSLNNQWALNRVFEINRDLVIWDLSDVERLPGAHLPFSSYNDCRIKRNKNQYRVKTDDNRIVYSKKIRCDLTGKEHVTLKKGMRVEAIGEHVTTTGLNRPVYHYLVFFVHNMPGYDNLIFEHCFGLVCELSLVDINPATGKRGIIDDPSFKLVDADSQWSNNRLKMIKNNIKLKSYDIDKLVVPVGR